MKSINSNTWQDAADGLAGYEPNPNHNWTWWGAERGCWQMLDSQLGSDIDMDTNWGSGHTGHKAGAPAVNPTFDPSPPKVQIWSFPFTGDEPILIDEGISPIISPNSDMIVYIKKGQLWVSSIDGKGDRKNIFH